MAALVGLFGDTLVTPDGTERATAGALAGCDAIGVYFSAHWCGPCRRFTPHLADVYKQLRADGKKFEVVFASSDQDEASFKEYHSSMPWLAVPFANRAAKDALSKKYKVSGIPTLVILDGAGKTATTDGRSAVMEPEKFPWVPPTLGELLAGPFVRPSGGGEVPASELAGKTLGLYFSAHWCPPCRGFTPKLVDTYKAVRAGPHGDEFEIVFVSSDHDATSFKEYHDSMPWLALPFSDRDAKAALSSRFGVRGIPSLVIVGPADGDGNREVVNDDARGTVGSDPSGANFPWRPPAVALLEDAGAGINDTPTVVVLADGLDAAAAGAIRADLTPVAEKVIAAAKAAGEDGPPVLFAVAGPGDQLAPRVRGLCGIGDASADGADVLLLNLSDDGAWYRGERGGVSADAVSALVEGFKAGALERRQLS